MAQETVSFQRHGNAYNIFILILTIISLVIMVVMLLPLDDATIGLLQFYDALICVFFLVDFFFNLRAVSKKSDYFIKERGWLDLLGSIPSLGIVFKFSGLLRLARLNRFVRIAHAIRGKSRGALLADIIKNRSHYAAGITVLITIIILSSSSVLVLQFESQAPGATITTGWDAFWYSIVTITTVGYGDFFPITFWGRVTAMFIMITGVGIIGMLASLMSSLLIGSPSAQREQAAQIAESVPKIENELAALKNEVAAIRQLLEKNTPGGDSD